MAATNDRCGGSHVDRVFMNVTLDLTAARILSPRHCMARKASSLRARGWCESRVSMPWVVPTASKRLSDARATLWTKVDEGGSPARVALIGFDRWARLGRLGVETRRSRAYISQNHLRPSYDGRHGLRRPSEVGRRASASARRRAGILVLYTTPRQGRGYSPTLARGRARRGRRGCARK